MINLDSHNGFRLITLFLILAKLFCVQSGTFVNDAKIFPLIDFSLKAIAHTTTKLHCWSA